MTCQPPVVKYELIEYQNDVGYDLVRRVDSDGSVRVCAVSKRTPVTPNMFDRLEWDTDPCTIDGIQYGYSESVFDHYRMMPDRYEVTVWTR